MWPQHQAGMTHGQLGAPAQAPPPHGQPGAPQQPEPQWVALVSQMGLERQVVLAGQAQGGQAQGGYAP